MPAKVLADLTPEEKAKLVSSIRKDYEEAKGHFKYYHKPRFDKYYKNFRDDGSDRLAKLKQIGGEDWMSNLFIPITSSQIRVANSKLNVRLPEWKVWAANESAETKVEDVNTMLEYVFEKTKMIKRVKDIAKTAMIYGIAFGKKIWLKELKYRQVWEKKEVNGEKQVELVKKEGYKINDPALVNADVYSCWPDPKGNVINYDGQNRACEYLIDRYLLTKKQIAEQYNVALDVLDSIKGNGYDTTDYGQVKLDSYLKTANDKSTNRTGIGTASTSSTDVTEVFEHWTDTEWTVSVGSTILIHMPNPYGFSKPYERLCYEELPGQMYGVGIAEQVEQPQAGVNTIANLTTDTATLNTFNMWISPENQNFNSKTFVIRPGGVISGDVKPMPKTQVDPASYRERDIQLGYVDMATGFSDPGNAMASTVATSVNAQETAIEDRLGMFVENLNEFYGGVMESFVDYMYWYYPTRTFTYVLEDEENQMLPPEEQKTGEVTTFDFYIPIENKEGGRDYKAIKQDSLNDNFYFRYSNRSDVSSNKDLKKRQNNEAIDRLMGMSQNEYFAPAVRELDPTRLVSVLIEGLGYDPDKMRVDQETKMAQDAEREQQAMKAQAMQQKPQGENRGGPRQANSGVQAAGFNQNGMIPKQVSEVQTVDDRGQGQDIGSMLSNIMGQ